jgi:putative membrane protein
VTDGSEQRTQLAHERTDLAVERTVMANERTLMAWGRTGLSQIGLGLSLFKFLEAIEAHGGARRFALVVIALGTVAAAFGVADYLATTSRLSRTHAIPRNRRHWVMAASIALFGAIVLVALMTEYVMR